MVITIVINRSDGTDSLITRDAERIKIPIAGEMGSGVISRIPFDDYVNDALMASKTVIDYGKGPAFESLVSLWNQLLNAI